MMDTKKREDTLIDIGKKFVEFHEFLEESDLSNSSELYEKKYQAINILREMKTQLNDVTTNLTESNREIVMLAIVCLNIGILYTHVEETKNAEEHFMECIELLTGRELQPDVIIPVISTLNQLGLLWAQWSQPTKAKGFLDTAEELYINFTTNIQLDPISMEIVMGVEDGKLGAKNILKKLHTLTLYYLAQVYEALEDKDKFAAYCHKTLSLQLSQNKELHDLDYVDWALNAATLSQYFLEHDCFSQARYHLNAASYMLEQYENIMLVKNNKEMSDNVASELENYNHRSADVARCWAKYGVTLLSVSKERLLKKVEQEDEPSSSETNLITTVECVKPAEDLKFVDLEVDLEATINQITDKYLLDFNDARSVFLNVQRWLNQAKTYYTLDGHASDYAHIAQDISQAYKYLAFFEESEDRQAKMHKRRINILEEIVNELNPQYYKTICREIWIELGETYSDILQIKNDKLQNTNDPTTHMITKINHLAQNSIKNFQLYLDSVKITKSNDGIETIPDDQLFSVLYAYFHLGRLYNRIIGSLSLKIENTQRSIDAYKFVVDYYEKHPEKTEEIRKYGFINLCHEFVVLLPLKLQSLKNQLINE